MNNGKWVSVIIWIFNISIILFDVNQFVTKIKPLLDMRKYREVQAASVVDLPIPVDLGIQFDYCVFQEDNPDELAQFVAGTPIPYESVPVSTDVVAEQPSPVVESELANNFVPTLIPTVIPTSTPTGSQFSNLKVVSVGKYNENNFHVVLVGVGHIKDIDVEMQRIIDNFSKNFTGVNVDFAFVDSTIDLDFKHIQQQVNFENENDQKILFNAIKQIYPVDGLVVAIDTPLYLGTSHGNAAMLTLKDPYTIVIATHEIGHQLGLDDGYQFPYEDGYLPNTELFFKDEMPSRFIKALNKLDEAPSLYKVGTCNGRAVYSFYESNNNIMRDYAPADTKSWGTTTFTPLQIILMNDYIVWYKGVYN